MNTTITSVNVSSSFSVDATSSMTTPEVNSQEIWDHIAGSFCSTNVMEARQHLQVFLDPEKSENECAKSFMALKSLLSPACHDHFKVSADHENGGRGEF